MYQGSSIPDKIKPDLHKTNGFALDVSRYGEHITGQKDAFLCAALGTKIDIAFNKKLGSGFFGGLNVVTVIARSSVNVNNGASNRSSNFFHAIFFVLSVFSISLNFHFIVD